MSGVDPARRVSTAGAWLGAFVAVWAAATVAWHVAWLAAATAAPGFVNRAANAADDQAGPTRTSESILRLLDLGLDASRRIAAYARVADGSAVVLGFALFLAAFALLRGSGAGRRAVRALLALKAVHSLAAAAWLVVLWSANPDGLRCRLDAILAEASREAAGGTRTADAVERVSAWSHAAPVGFAAVVLAGVGASAFCFWLAGRPSARAWCDARSGGTDALAKVR